MFASYGRGASSSCTNGGSGTTFAAAVARISVTARAVVEAIIAVVFDGHGVNHA